MVLNVLTQDASGRDAQEDDAERYRERYDLSWHVLADPDGGWMAEWGANGGTSQHSYAVIDGDGVITWRLANGSSTNVSEVEAAVEAAGN